jgi:hypothetical protein
MKKELVKNITVSIISLLIFLITMEIIMRSSWKMGGWGKHPIYRRSLNPYLRYELIPGIKSASMSTNSDGLRGPEYPLLKSAGTFRIIMLGDSELLSVMLPYSDTLPVQLENLLNHNSGPKHFEVLNFGVEGYNTLQELEQLKVKGLKYNPDLIILNYCLNDPGSAGYCFSKDFLTRHSALVRYFTYLIRNTLLKQEKKRLNISTEIDEFNYIHLPNNFAPVNKAIQEMAGISKTRNNKLVVVVFPASSLQVPDFRQHYPYWRLHRIVKGIKSDNIIFIDLIDEFNRLGMTPQSVSINYKYNESHKNAAALKVSANYIYEILKENKLIPD